MKRLRCAFGGIVLSSLSVAAQSPPPAGFLGGLRLSGPVDGYYSFNLAHPPSRANQLRNFDVKADRLSLNMAKLTLEGPTGQVGFRLDAGVGDAFRTMHGGSQSRAELRNLQQAFLLLKPAKARDLELSFGKFVTCAGAEVTETHSNWNYSRSLLFAWAIPYYHFGLRASAPLTGKFTAGVQLVNGWNNVAGANGGRTVGLTGALVRGKASWFCNYYVGPRMPGKATACGIFTTPRCCSWPSGRPVCTSTSTMERRSEPGPPRTTGWESPGLRVFLCPAGWA